MLAFLTLRRTTNFRQLFSPGYDRHKLRRSLDWFVKKPPQEVLAKLRSNFFGQASATARDFCHEHLHMTAAGGLSHEVVEISLDAPTDEAQEQSAPLHETRDFGDVNREGTPGGAPAEKLMAKELAREFLALLDDKERIAVVLLSTRAFSIADPQIYVLCGVKRTAISERRHKVAAQKFRGWIEEKLVGEDPDGIRAMAILTYEEMESQIFLWLAAEKRHAELFGYIEKKIKES